MWSTQRRDGQNLVRHRADDGPAFGRLLLSQLFADEDAAWPDDPRERAVARWALAIWATVLIALGAVGHLDFP